jgi:hypothetical protein
MFSLFNNQNIIPNINQLQLFINQIPSYVPYLITYFFAFIILSIILFFVYVRIKFRFWALQPVFHIYDVYYWFFNVGIINKDLPLKNRYTNFKNIKTISFDILSKQNIKDFTLLVQLNYLRNKENTFTPLEENILPYFKGHNDKSFWSFYWEPELILDPKTNNIIPSEKLIGAITGRPLTVTFLKGNPETKETNSNPLALTSLKPLNGSLALTSLKPFLKVYYIDYLCVDKNYRKKGIAPQLIQTHEYNQSHLNKGICVSLFKREDDLTGIVPLTVYKSYCFNMRKWNCPQPMDPKMTLLQGDKQNMYYLYNFIKEREKDKEGKWQITILPDMSNLMELISSKNMFISMILIDGNIEAAYVFKKSCTYIEKDKEVICCIASMYNNSKMQEEEFIRGFKVSLWSIIERPENKQFHYLTVEDTSDNGCIIRNIERKTHPTVVSPTAYFFYNFAYNTFKSEDVFIIC